MAEPKFEKDLEKLEKIVESLENGELSLDESLKRFEEGVKLAKRCDNALGAAEKRIEILTKNDQGELEAQPFGDDAPKAEPSSTEPVDESPAPDPGEDTLF